MASDAGQLVLILIVPVLWILWLWVHHYYSLKLTIFWLMTILNADDRLKAHNRFSFVSSVLQLSGNGVFCQRRKLSGPFQSRSM
jgi:hypothetical protein